MNSEDTVKLVNPAEVNDFEKILINTKFKPLSLFPPKALSADDPKVADFVKELEEEFAVSESDKVFFADQQVNKRKAQEAIRAQSPRNFLQAHMVIIDQLLMDPGITATALAAATGYHRQWLHKVMSSDAFQAKLAERQKAICDPIILNAIQDRLTGIVSRSLEVLEDRMDSEKISMADALAVFTASAKALGLGGQKVAPTQQQFIVHMPAPGMSAKGWAEQYSKSTSGIVTLDGAEGSGATEMVQTIEAASMIDLGDLSTVGAVIREVPSE